MKSFSDPECLRERRGIAFEEERIVCERDEFDYFASLSGLAAAGVTSVKRVSKLIRRLEDSEDPSTVSYDIVLRLTSVWRIHRR